MKKLTIVMIIFFNLANLFCQEESSAGIELSFVVSENADHRNIKNVFVSISDETGESARTNWEEILLENGYNVITRSKIEMIMKEQKMSISGLSNEIEIGELIGADAIFLVDSYSTTLELEDTNSIICYPKIKIISVKTGEILMIASAYSGATFYRHKADNTNAFMEELENSNAKLDLWRNTLIPRYKKKVSKIYEQKSQEQ